MGMEVLAGCFVWLVIAVGGITFATRDKRGYR
jgi:hypothetical protein